MYDLEILRGTPATALAWLDTMPELTADATSRGWALLGQDGSVGPKFRPCKPGSGSEQAFGKVLSVSGGHLIVDSLRGIKTWNEWIGGKRADRINP
jgi:hypothetical protein